MSPAQIGLVAIRALLRNKLRSFLTALGVIIGVGAVIAMTSIGAGARARVEETFAAMGTRMLVVPTDVSDPASIAALFETVRATYGRIDLLFNNAGISTRNIPIDELTYEQWSNVVAVNLTGAFLCAQHAFRMMKNQTPRGGRIINNGSVSAHVPRRNATPYTATKHALTGLTRSLSLDGREFDIACGQIDIGNAATARIDVDDVARGVAYMASLSLEVNVQFMTVMATKMPYIGRG